MEDPTRPQFEELGARSERQRQAQPMAECFAQPPLDITLARERRGHYDPHATVEKINKAAMYLLTAKTRVDQFALFRRAVLRA